MKHSTEYFEKLIHSLSRDDLAWIDQHWHKPVQLFTFVDCTTGKSIHVKVTELVEAIDEKKVPHKATVIAFPEDLYRQIIDQQGIERDHLDEINLDDAVYHPAIIVEQAAPDMPEGVSHIIVDGNHKLVKSFELGLRKHPAYVVRFEDIGPFICQLPPLISELMKSLTIENKQLSQVIAEIREAKEKELHATSE